MRLVPEFAKAVLQSDDTSTAAKLGAQSTLLAVLESILRLLHPLMPFITEEIWTEVARRAAIEGDTIMLRPYPTVDPTHADNEAENDIEWVKQFILGIRQIRGEMDVSPGKIVPVLLADHTERDVERAAAQVTLLSRVGRVESVRALDDAESAPLSATALHGSMRLLVPMAGIIDTEAETARLKNNARRCLQISNAARENWQTKIL